MTNKNYKWFMLAVLVVVYVINIIDRHVINILLEPIKNDLELTDAQAGFVAGLAFALFYTIMGIPIATLADRFSRTKVIAVCSAIWSAMTALTGAAGNYLVMAGARMGVGIGEAGLTPSANSLIGDLFEPADRGKAIGIYHVAVPVGTMLAGFVGGWLESIVGWRNTFLILGIAGMVITGLFILVFREPPRGEVDDIASRPEQDRYSILDTIKFLYSKTSCRYFFPAFALIGFVASAINTWTPAYFMRTFDMSLMSMATTIGLVGGIGGAIGMLAGGVFADRLGSRDVSAYLKIPAIAMALTFPPTLGLFLAGWPWLASIFFLAPVITVAIVTIPVLALLQRLAKNNMRAVAVALFLLVIHLVGMGFGPIIVGLISDMLNGVYGDDSLRIALLAIVPLNLVAIWLFWRGSRFVASDLNLPAA